LGIQMSIAQQTYYNYLMKRSGFSFWARRFFIQDLTRHFQGHILDIGCGIGEFLKLYPNSFGVDINPFVVKHCQKQGDSCCISGAYPLPFAAHSFDGVLASNILEHLDSGETAVSEAARVLKPGGVLVVTVPLEAGYRHDPTHIRFLATSDLRQLAQQAGLSTKTIYRYPFRAAWPGKWFYFCELRAVFVKAREDAKV
jgi:SAM-dependent methyltransferase